MLVLASASPRRALLLRQLGLEFEVNAPVVDETPPSGLALERAAVAVARRKVDAIRRTDSVVLGADTAVILGGHWMGKPRDAADARAMLEKLSARDHLVLTAVAVRGETGVSVDGVESTTVRFRRLSSAQIASYVDTGEPLDKAGAYGIQGQGAALVESIRGDFFNVVGLPLRLTLALLDRVGYPLPAHLKPS